jgi:hypothetical protein
MLYLFVFGTACLTQLQDVNKHCNIGWLLLYCTNDGDDCDDIDDDDDDNNNKNGIVQNV